MGNCTSDRRLIEKRALQHGSIRRMLSVEPLAEAAWRLFVPDQRVRRRDECGNFEKLLAPMLGRMTLILGHKLSRKIRIQAASHVETCIKLYSLQDDSSRSNRFKLRLLSWRLQESDAAAAPAPSAPVEPLALVTSHLRLTLEKHEKPLVAAAWGVAVSGDVTGMRRVLSVTETCLVAELRGAAFILRSALDGSHETALCAKVGEVCGTLEWIASLVEALDV